MPKNKTPLLRPLRENGATLYVFPSASEDIGLNKGVLFFGIFSINYTHFYILFISLIAA